MVATLDKPIKLEDLAMACETQEFSKAADNAVGVLGDVLELLKGIDDIPTEKPALVLSKSLWEEFSKHSSKSMYLTAPPPSMESQVDPYTLPEVKFATQKYLGHDPAYTQDVYRYGSPAPTPVPEIPQEVIDAFVARAKAAYEKSGLKPVNEQYWTFEYDRPDESAFFISRKVTGGCLGSAILMAETGMQAGSIWHDMFDSYSNNTNGAAHFGSRQWMTGMIHGWDGRDRYPYGSADYQEGHILASAARQAILG